MAPSPDAASEKARVSEAPLHYDPSNATEQPQKIAQDGELSAADRALAEQYGYQPVCLMPENKQQP